MEAERELLGARRAEDHLADRRGLVVHVADAPLEALDVQLHRAEQADLLLRREDELDPGVAPLLLEDTACGLEHRDDCGLVVGTEDRPPGVAHEPVLVDHRVERAVERHGVEVRAEEERDAALDRPRQPADDVPGRRPEPFGRVVLLPGEPESVELGGHAVGDGTLFARRARDGAQLEEEVDDP